MKNIMHLNARTKWIAAGILLIFVALAGAGASLAAARSSEAPQEQISPLHPGFALLDVSGTNVLTNHTPVSTMKTCG